MLHKEAVNTSTLELIKTLQQKEYLHDFYLVGGTALALYYGHRKSIDIDLFTAEPFNTEYVLDQLTHDFTYQVDFTALNTLKGSISAVEVDIITHRYPYIDKPYKHEGITLISEQDIIAMKLNAISTSGDRVKDFIDIYYALDNYAFAQILSFYKEKYNQSNDTHILKSLVYYEDVNLSEWPIMLKEPALKWEKVKKKLEKVVTSYLGV